MRGGMAEHKVKMKLAVEALEKLGLKRKIIIRALKDLLRKCDNDWTHIEADRYSLLVECYFEKENEDTETTLTKRSSEERDYSENVEMEKRTMDAPEKAEKLSSIRQSIEEVVAHSTSQGKQGDKRETSLSASTSSSSSLDNQKSGISKGLNGSRHIRNETNGSNEKQTVKKNVQQIICRENLSPGLLADALKKKSVNPSAKEVPTSKYNESKAECSITSSLVKRRKLILPEDETSHGALHNRSSSTEPSPHIRQERTLGDSHREDSKKAVTRRLKHNPVDISRGEEAIPVTYVNEFTKDALPDIFHYIPRNLIYQNAHINFSIARIGEDDCCSCVGSCVTARIPCACTRETGGQYAYTPDGLLQEWFLEESIKDKRNDASNSDRFKSYCKNNVCQILIVKEGDYPEPCRGHYPRKFVKECCSKCGCTRLCGNRVVQRGICLKLQVFWTPEGKGWGLRTLEDLPKGAFVCEYVGEIMTNYELYTRNQTILKNAKHTYPVLLDADICSERHLADEALCLDATFYGNVARFINHRCYDSNLLDVPVSFDSADRHYYHHAFFTTRPVKAMEELTWDYSIDFDDEGHPIQCFECHCGSEYCRGKRARR